jgi:hypothetical protein
MSIHYLSCSSTFECVHQSYGRDKQFVLRAYILFRGTWQINLGLTCRRAKIIDIVPKIVTILLPALVLGIVQIPGVSHQHMAYLV